MDELTLKLKERIAPFIRRREFVFELAALPCCVLLSSFVGDKTGLAPLGTAAAAALVIFGFAPYLPLLGCAAGAALAGAYASAAATALFGAALLIYGRLSERPLKTDMLLLLIISKLLMLPLFYMESISALLRGTMDAALCVAAAGLMHRALIGLRAMLGRRSLAEHEQLALTALTALAVLCAQNAQVLSVSLAKVLAALLAMVTARIKGPAAVAAAVLYGAAAVLGGGYPLLTVGCVAGSALAGAALKPLHKWGVGAGFFAVATALAYFLGGSAALSWWEAGIAALLLFCVPDRLYARLESHTALSDVPSEAERRLGVLRRRVRDASDVIGELSTLYAGGAGQDERTFAGRQLGAVSAALAALSAEPEPKRRRYDIRLGAAACAKDGAEETGDSIAMREAQGLLMLALSDGMGSGAAAHTESSEALAMLGDMLAVGFELSAALECVNRLLMLHGDGDMYATLDAALIDLETGDARFIKSGAPPSYILRDGRVYTMYAEALPIGIIATARAAVHTGRLRRGDTLVMLTDGVFDALGKELFAALLERAGAANTAEDAASAVLAAACEKNRADDMSVIVARVS